MTDLNTIHRGDDDKIKRENTGESFGQYLINPNQTVKVEEINLNLVQLPYQPHQQADSQQGSVEGGKVLCGIIKKMQVRAQYRTSSQCPQITIQYRIIQSLKQQKSLKAKILNPQIRKNSSNQTKNIAKNYGKAIIAFIQRNKKIFRQVCKQTSTPYQRITQELAEIKTHLTTVMGFREIWTTYKYAQCMRVISTIFLKKSALGYIFNSKVANVQTHIKYRNKFLDSLKNPAGFDHIKDY